MFVPNNKTCEILNFEYGKTLISFDNKLLLIGEHTSEELTTKWVLQYYFQLNDSKRMPDMNPPRYDHCSIVVEH